MNPSFWRGKKVFVTGHTGFKGSWLSIWLQELGCQVTGYSLDVPTSPSMFEDVGIDKGMECIQGDIRQIGKLEEAMKNANPDIVFHMAAQPLVRHSYTNPVETYATNVMGTVNLLESVRKIESLKVVINITSDKCYENQEWVWGYRENDPMGGYDPYSSSKGCAELVANAYRRSYFSTEDSCLALSSVRAGNVIGGGDWATDRLIPDIIRSLISGNVVTIRNPAAVRPWQHVLEPLRGYMTLAEQMWENGKQYSGGWNFGPDDNDAKPVEWIADKMVELWGREAKWALDTGDHPHEAHYLKLDCSKAHVDLGWKPVWDLDMALHKVVEWYKAHAMNSDIREITMKQIRQYQSQA